MGKKLSDLLGTRNPKEQAEKVEALINTVQAPVADLVIRFDGRIGQVVQVSVIGPQVVLDDALAILEGARLFLLAQQKAARKTEPGTATPQENVTAPS